MSGVSVVGVDGCRGGWVVVERTVGSADRQPTASLVTDLAPLIQRLRAGRVLALAIDMPIGLLDVPTRSCDVEARRMLGPRRSSVFPAPMRVTLQADDYQHACRLSRQVGGKALSKQAFNLLPKIAQVDELVQPPDQDRLVEAHPECAFVRLAGRPPPEPKRTVAGRAERLALLADHDRTLTDLIDARPDLPTLDLIDAAVLTITAAHVVAGTEVRLGNDVDATGLQARIVF